MSTLFTPDLSPNPFHDAPAVHTHANCSYCHKFRNCEPDSRHLKKCVRCSTALYCSKECQRGHWPQHETSCNAAATLDTEIERKTGIKHGYTDLTQWVEYYSTPMKNCMVASLNLPNFSHQERDSVLVVTITHKRDLALPIQHRFTIDAISRYNRNETGAAARALMERLDSVEMKNSTEFGKMEMGKYYYGTAMITVVATFSPSLSVPAMKIFSIDKSVASANVISGPWWPPLREIMEKGKKMKFCCGRLEGGGCCCGGWVHQEDARKGDAWR